MASKLKLSPQEVNRLRKDAQQCQDAREDLERAIKAGVPNCDILISKLDILENRINLLLTVLGGE